MNSMTRRETLRKMPALAALAMLFPLRVMIKPEPTVFHNCHIKGPLKIHGNDTRITSAIIQSTGAGIQIYPEEPFGE